jgi:hypothetical protein
MGPPSSISPQTTTNCPNPTVLPLQVSYPATRSRTRRLLQTYREDFDALPEAPAPLPPNDTGALAPPCRVTHASCKRVRLVQFETSVDSFGRYRIYTSKPLTIPDSSCALADFSDQSIAPRISDNPSPSTSLHEAIAPCPNLSTFYFLYWFWKGSNKSIASREELRSNVILQPDFNPYDLATVNLQAIDKQLAGAAHSQLDKYGGAFKKSDGWTERAVSIQVPILGKGKAAKTAAEQHISVPGMLNFKCFHVLHNTDLY